MLERHGPEADSNGPAVLSNQESAGGQTAASEVLARWIKHLPLLCRDANDSQSSVEDASHDLNYPRCRGKRNEIL